MGCITMTGKDNLMYLIEEAEELFPTQVEAIADHLIANGVTVQRWIPVTERLPEIECCTYSVDVLFYVRDDGIYAGYVNHETGTWKCRCHAVKFAKNKVTHWMPLPEPPKEVE